MSKQTKKSAHPRKSTKKQTKRQKPKILQTKYVIIFFAVVAVIIAWHFYPHGESGKLLTIHDRGQNRVVLTKATTIRGALQDAHITVAPQDVVEPAIDSKLLASDSAVIIYRSRPVLVVDGALRQKIVTAAASPNEIATAAGLAALSDIDKAAITEGDQIKDGASAVLTIERQEVNTDTKPDLFKPTPQTLTRSKGAQIFTDSNGVAHRETYYDLPMNIVIGACGPGGYTIRYDGAKIDKDGYVLVAASYRNYPKCSVVETSMGLGKVYDTGGFALRYPHGFDLATDWSNGDGR